MDVVCRAQRSLGTPAGPSGRAYVAARAQREVTLLDYGAGNVRSVRNALSKLDCEVKEVCMYHTARAIGAAQYALDAVARRAGRTICPTSVTCQHSAVVKCS